MVDSTSMRLMELKEKVDSTTSFKDHSSVFPDVDYKINEEFFLHFFIMCIS